MRGLEKAGFQAFLVGGSVRNILLGRPPKDWDVATDAEPKEILGLFPDSVYENTFGTVGVKIPASLIDGGSSDETVIVEVTTFRREGKYSDLRHPDEVVFTKEIREDLARRDFTVNAMAAGLSEREENGETEISLVDPFGGQVDLKARTIRAVGEPNQRFQEDALRLKCNNN